MIGYCYNYRQQSRNSFEAELVIVITKYPQLAIAKFYVIKQIMNAMRTRVR